MPNKTSSLKKTRTNPFTGRTRTVTKDKVGNKMTKKVVVTGRDGKIKKTKTKTRNGGVPSKPTRIETKVTKRKPTTKVTKRKPPTSVPLKRMRKEMDPPKKKTTLQKFNELKNKKRTEKVNPKPKSKKKPKNNSIKNTPTNQIPRTIVKKVKQKVKNVLKNTPKQNLKKIKKYI